MFDRLRRLEQSVRRTRDAFFGHVADLFDRRELDENLWDELEELLIGADVGVPTTEYILNEMRRRVEAGRVKEPAAAGEILQNILTEILTPAGESAPLLRRTGGLTTILVIGVNGVGKTTTIAKLAQLLRKQGQSVVIAAGDTFRAAAIDQLKIWGERIGASVISHQPGADPGAVVFDAWQAASSRGADVLIIDTAGRLHTKVNLMEELRKIHRILQKQDSAAPDATLLVLDATTGQNALSQAREFQNTIGITGLVLTKVDGTARGGSIFPIAAELKLPILYLGTGEKSEDLDPFDPAEFVRALLRPATAPPH